MRIKQRLAIILALCMLITALAPGAEAVGIWANRLNGGKGILRENVLFDLLDGSLFDLDLFRKWDTDLNIEKIDDDQEVKIFIIMDSPSVVEQNADAVYGPEAQKTMDALSAQQNSFITDSISFATELAPKCISTVGLYTHVMFSEEFVD